MPRVFFVGCCYVQDSEGEWRDIYGDPVRPRRNGYEWPPDLLQVTAWLCILIFTVLHFTIQIPFLTGAFFITVIIISAILIGMIVIVKIVL